MMNQLQKNLEIKNLKWKKWLSHGNIKFKPLIMSQLYLISNVLMK